MAMAIEKHIICRFVRLNTTFVFTVLKSFGTGTYAIISPPYLLQVL